ncbi:MAG: LuxR C-terminal-related transcriptional regulator [Gaiellaceae bacterium]
MGKEEQTEVPLGRRHIIERPRLTRLLDETSARVIMLVAPAGYGKTTLARQWLASRRFAWFAATSASGDVAGLAAGIARSVSTISGVRTSSVLTRLSGGYGLPQDLSELAELQIEELSSWPADAWLAIDEYEWLVASGAADEYIRLLLEGSTLNLFLTSRARPSWATARKRLYGDFALLDRSLLKMDSEEAHQLFAQADRPISETFLESAAGWPAVLALAALSPSEDLSNAIPETLYEYLAEELFNKSSRLLRDALPVLALAPHVSRQIVAVACSQAEGDLVIRQAAEAGYLGESGGVLSIHPLLKDFLLAKLDPTDERAITASAELIAFFVEGCAWDDAFHVAQNLTNPQSLLLLIEAGSEPLLRSGRTATLSEWIDAARRQEAETSLLDLIEAELSAREGRMRLAERMALYVARSGEPSIRFRALCLAGRTAHLDNRESDCLRHFRAAEEMAQDEQEKHEATWGVLLAASACRPDEVQEALAAFLEHEPRGPDDIVRACNARLAWGIFGDLRSAVRDALPLLRLESGEVDPVILTSFRHALGRSLMLLGRYEEALEIANENLALAEATRLAFVLPHALVSRAGALLGLGLYGDARSTLSKAEQHASSISDQHNLIDVRAVGAKLAIATGDADRAIGLTDDEVFGVTDGMLADYRATNALALACAGRAPEAERVLATALDTSGLQEVRSLASATRSVLAARAGDGDVVREELLSVNASGVVDSIVIARRGSPELAALMDDLAPLDPATVDPLTSYSTTFKAAPALASLTKRELEVLALLRMGNTNREIADQLVIEEVTAKVHVHHILRKLQVRSRTEAAVLAEKLASDAPIPDTALSTPLEG